MLTKNEIKYLCSLQQKKGRAESGCFICEGDKLVSEALESDHTIKSVYLTPQWIGLNKKLKNGVEISESEMKKISGMTTVPGILAVVEMKKDKPADFKKLKNEVFLVLDDIRDPGNLGTIIRTADWFGIKYIFCSENTVEQYNPKVVQASMGSIFRMEINYVNCFDLIQNGLMNGLDFYAAVLNGKPISNKFMTKGGLIMGSESHGIHPDLLMEKAGKITIPSFGKAESLNVATATGILLAMLKID